MKNREANIGSLDNLPRNPPTAEDVTTSDLRARIADITSRLCGADPDVVSECAAECGWDEDNYYDLCWYSERDDAWYPKDGSDLSIVDHAMAYLEHRWGLERPLLEEIERLEAICVKRLDL